VGRVTTDAARANLAQAQADYAAYQAKGLNLNMQRGLPSHANFALCADLVSAIGPEDLSMDGIDLRNYGGGLAGLPSARGACSPTISTWRRRTSWSGTTPRSSCRGWC
jgi:hypothetical protein